MGTANEVGCEMNLCWMRKMFHTCACWSERVSQSVCVRDHKNMSKMMWEVSVLDERDVLYMCLLK